MYQKLRKYNSDVHIYTFDPTQERLGIDNGIDNKLEPLSKLGHPQTGETILCRVNCHFFDMSGAEEYYGLFIEDGVKQHGESPTFKSVTFANNKLVYGVAPSASIGFGVSFTLVLDGKIAITNTAAFPHYKQDEPRTCIGQKADGKIVLIVVQGRTTNNAGMTAQELAQTMLDLGCINAFNLDGGGSSEMIVNISGVQKIVNQPTDGRERAVGTGLCVYGRKNPMKVFIDVGHGGSDNGASANGMVEKNINLTVGLKLAELLRHNGFEVKLSRETDLFVDLAIRSQMANAWGAEIFISVHHNAGGGSMADGYQVIHALTTGEDDRLAQLIGAEFLTIGQKRHSIYTRESGSTPGKDYYAVLRNTTCPVRVITEYAFLDTQDYLDIDTIQEQYNEAYALARAVCKFVGKTFVDPALPVLDWKEEAIKKLFENGLISDVATWLAKKDEPTPFWATATIFNNLLKKINQ